METGNYANSVFFLIVSMPFLANHSTPLSLWKETTIINDVRITP